MLRNVNNNSQDCSEINLTKFLLELVDKKYASKNWTLSSNAASKLYDQYYKLIKFLLISME